MATIKHDEFKRAELRIGIVTHVEEHPGADKLYIIRVDLGDSDSRQLVAGLRPYYEKEALVGKRIVVLTNLEPARLRGVESQGMLLAARHGECVAVLTTDRDIPAGSEIL